MPVYEVEAVNSYPYYLKKVASDLEELIFLVPDTVTPSEFNDCAWLNNEEFLRYGPELIQGKKLKSYGFDPRFQRKAAVFV